MKPTQLNSDTDESKQSIMKRLQKSVDDVNNGLQKLEDIKTNMNSIYNTLDNLTETVNNKTVGVMVEVSLSDTQKQIDELNGTINEEYKKINTTKQIINKVNHQVTVTTDDVDIVNQEAVVDNYQKPQEYRNIKSVVNEMVEDPQIYSCSEYYRITPIDNSEVKSFSELTEAFFRWHRDNGIIYDIHEMVKYVWQFPQHAVDQWKKELVTFKDVIPGNLYDAYQDQFDPPGGIILGVPTLAPHSNSNFAKLYKTTHRTQTFSKSNILVSADFTLSNYGTEVDVPGGGTANLPAAIVYNSVKFDAPLDLEDNRVGYIRGSLIGEGFIGLERNHNRKNKESVLCTIDYQSGAVHLIRSNKENERKFIQAAAAANSSTNNGSSGTGTGSGTQISYDYLDVSGTYDVLSGPLTCVFTFDVRKGSPEPKSDLLAGSEDSLIVQENINRNRPIGTEAINKDISTVIPDNINKNAEDMKTNFVASVLQSYRNRYTSDTEIV